MNETKDLKSSKDTNDKLSKEFEDGIKTRKNSWNVKPPLE
jgi:hypothetical protein